MEGDLDKSTIVMNWGDEAKAIEAATKGYSVIMTPGKPITLIITRARIQKTVWPSKVTTRWKPCINMNRCRNQSLKKDWPEK